MQQEVPLVVLDFVGGSELVVHYERKKGLQQDKGHPCAGPYGHERLYSQTLRHACHDLCTEPKFQSWASVAPSLHRGSCGRPHTPQEVMRRANLVDYATVLEVSKVHNVGSFSSLYIHGYFPKLLYYFGTPEYEVPKYKLLPRKGPQFENNPRSSHPTP